MNALKEKILSRIAAEGPITLAQYVQMALYDPEHGYYMKGDPFGAKGDFITAPEVSQIFGELIGLWFVQAWEDRGRPKPFHLVELGPGRGTLMADMLRTARLRPEFLTAAEVLLMETSPALRSLQRQTLKDASAHWIDSVAGLADEAPLYVVANEFLDALPVRQFVFVDGRWHERMVTAKGNELAFVPAPDPAQIDTLPKHASPGDVMEVSLIAHGVIAELASRLALQSGLALFIDYGHESGHGDSLQAVKAHQYADPLAEPGEADLTTRVDFAALAKIAREMKVQVCGPIAQSTFLESLGIHARAERLRREADANTRAMIDTGVERLISPKQMGTLFKVMALSSPDSPPLPGFKC